jgi:hypothetical protein
MAVTVTDAGTAHPLYSRRPYSVIVNPEKLTIRRFILKCKVIKQCFAGRSVNIDAGGRDE